MVGGLDVDEEPRRGVSRANSVRFDESANHGYYGQQPGRSSTSELPLRTGSGMGSHPLSERSLSHRSDGRQSSSGLSHHSTRTNSLETTSRMMGSTYSSDSRFIPPPGLFLLGPVPSIIRCWLTTNFSNESLQYAAVCSGSYSSFIGYPAIRKFDLEGLVDREEGGVDRIKLPLYLPEASVYQSSSRASSPVPQLPALTVRFVVREVNHPRDGSIQIILGSDLLRSHNADVLFSLDKVAMVDDERNKISVPLVRPENDSAFSSLCTAPEPLTRQESTTSYHNREAQTNSQVNYTCNVNDNSNGATAVGNIIGRQTQTSEPSRPEADDQRTVRPEVPEAKSLSKLSSYTGAADFQPAASSSSASASGVWGGRNFRADSSVATATAKSHGRTMKVLRPSKPQNRVNTSSPLSPRSAESEDLRASSPQQQSSALRQSTSESSSSKQWSSNPVGGASAFGWLNP